MEKVIFDNKTDFNDWSDLLWNLFSNVIALVLMYAIFSIPKIWGSHWIDFKFFSIFACGLLIFWTYKFLIQKHIVSISIDVDNPSFKIVEKKYFKSLIVHTCDISNTQLSALSDEYIEEPKFEIKINSKTVRINYRQKGLSKKKVLKLYKKLEKIIDSKNLSF
ncbi:hypothetical protein [Winogradskyella poriferorum]|uniref:Uncharacterized protein n=1 Tax=Winogradskyella poriferorum TaxID=307627 RepID=A0ABU7W0Q4_9FLAO